MTLQKYFSHSNLGFRNMQMEIDIAVGFLKSLIGIVARTFYIVF